MIEMTSTTCCKHCEEPVRDCQCDFRVEIRKLKNDNHILKELLNKDRETREYELIGQMLALTAKIENWKAYASFCKSCADGYEDCDLSFEEFIDQ